MVVFTGNSLTRGAGASPGQDYPSQTIALLGASYEGVNLGVDGVPTVSMIPQGPAADSHYDSNRPRNVCVFWEIINDILLALNFDGPTLFAHCQVYRDDREVAFGPANVITIDCLPSVLFTQVQEGNRQDCNARLAAEYSFSTSDPIIQRKLDGGLLVQASKVDELQDTGDVTYYVDGTHLSDAGYTLIARKVASAISM